MISAVMKKRNDRVLIQVSRTVIEIYDYKYMLISENLQVYELR